VCRASATVNSHLDLSNRELAVDDAFTSVKKRIGNRQSAPLLRWNRRLAVDDAFTSVKKRIGNRQCVLHFGETQAGS
jgi:hypothetical protein